MGHHSELCVTFKDGKSGLSIGMSCNGVRVDDIVDMHGDINAEAMLSELKSAVWRIAREWPDVLARGKGRSDNG